MFTQACDVNGIEFGERRLQRLLAERDDAAAVHRVARVGDAVRDFARGKPQFDHLSRAETSMTDRRNSAGSAVLRVSPVWRRLLLNGSLTVRPENGTNIASTPRVADERSRRSGIH